MRAWGLVGIVLFALSASVGAELGPLGQAQALHAGYHEDPKRLDQARDLLERMLREDPQVAAFILLSRIYLTWGDLRAPDHDARVQAYERGRDLGRRAVELAPKDPQARFWYAANLARWGQTRGLFRSLFVLPTLKKEIDTILELSPKHPAAHGLAGVFYLEVPPVLGGDLEQAEKYLRQALKLDPHFTVSRVVLARLLIKRGRYAEARRELRSVLTERSPSELADWAAKDKPEAQTLLDSIRGKE